MNCTALIHGFNKKVPTINGYQRYINFDNAASTPPFKQVLDHLYHEAAWYSGVHRGTGYKSQYSTKKYEEARETIARFVSTDLIHDTVIFTKNTTDAINKIAHYIDYLPGEKVIFTQIEHHSNELPWLKFPHIELNLKNDQLDLELLEHILTIHRGKLKLLAVSGASNVSGYTPPIHTLAELAHRAGAKILVDGAQLVPHRPVNIYPPDDPRHLDFLVFSGHKMYAPFGTGVLVGPRSFFKHYPPNQVGGGTVKGISPEGIIWADPPDVEEAGSPNVLGAIATAKAAEVLFKIGWPSLTEHEDGLVAYSLMKLREMKDVIIYNRGLTGRIGVISFNIEGVNHFQVAKYLADQGIGVRSGCFCARRYVLSLLNLNIRDLPVMSRQESEAGQLTTPGMVRISFGCYNQISEVDVLINALQNFIQKKSSGFNW